MLRSMINFALGVVLSASALAATSLHARAQGAAKARAIAPRDTSKETRTAGPQRSRNISIENDAMTLGSTPYNDAVKRFLEKDKLKIIGGEKAPAGAFPWQVSLGVSWITNPEYAHFCGGSVYNDRWIVTAAHCLRNTDPSQVIITAGTNRLVPGSTRRNVKRIILHKNYVQATFDNDIALMELLDPLPLGDKIRPVAPLSPGDEAAMMTPGAPLSVTGWGATEEDGDTVRVLRFLENIPVILRAVCNEPLSYDGAITENMFCAGVPGKDSCQGDSGGPVTAGTKASPRLAGVVSWGEGCGRPDKYGVYTRVPRYVAWIDSCVTNAATCNQ